MTPFPFQAHVALIVLKQRDQDAALPPVCKYPGRRSVAHPKSLSTQAAVVSRVNQPEEALSLVGIGGVPLLRGRGLFGLGLYGEDGR